ncbi:hypothetical protein L0337_42495 [candidate division KSB1 bacterium]|nr:hypothetical protein [candidate division KSB1 bacterium]
MKQVAENQTLQRVAIAILHYFRDHPSAKDSAMGIAKWWVGEEKAVVEKALTLLVNEEVIEKRRHLYQLAPGKPAAKSMSRIEKALQNLRRRR